MMPTNKNVTNVTLWFSYIQKRSNVLGYDIHSLENILGNLAPDGRRTISEVIVFCTEIKNNLMEF